MTINIRTNTFETIKYRISKKINLVNLFFI